MRHLIDSSVGRFRLVGFAEGASLLFLLMVAMPLKYWFGYPQAVKVGGWIHGILFIQYLYQAYILKEELNWHFKILCIAIIAAFVPFGTFIFDKWLKNQPHE